MRGNIRELTKLVMCPCCYTDMLLVSLNLELGRGIYKCPHCGYKKDLETAAS
jgi:peptide subunit release factor 1 (eRF1)